MKAGCNKFGNISLAIVEAAVLSANCLIGRKRSAQYFGTAGYKYTGGVHTAREFSPEMLTLIMAVEDRLGMHGYFNMALVNHYPDGVGACPECGNTHLTGGRIK